MACHLQYLLTAIHSEKKFLQKSSLYRRLIHNTMVCAAETDRNIRVIPSTPYSPFHSKSKDVIPVQIHRLDTQLEGIKLEDLNAKIFAGHP